MSQWFGNPDRKSGKLPGGTSGSGPNSRSRPQAKRPFREPIGKTDRFVRPPVDENVDDDDQWIDEVEEAPRTPQRPIARPSVSRGLPQPQRAAQPSSQRPRQRTAPNQYPAEPAEYVGEPGQYPGDAADQQERELAAGADPAGVPITRIEIGRRAVALIIDLLACYMASVGIMLIPFVGSFLNITLVLTLIFLIRDFFFEGRGIGKNFMGLQVVDRASGLPLNLVQSVQRNIVLIAPCLVTQVIGLALRLVPIPFLDHFVKEVVDIVSKVYVVIVLPLEAYRAYSRADGLRIGDEIAGTEIVESTMDFSKPLPRE